MPPRPDQRRFARALLPLLAWLCGIAVALSLRYGYYGDRKLVLGPNTSRMIRTSSLFVKQLQATGEAKQGVLLYGFNEKPQLSSENNWTLDHYLFVDAYDRKGVSLWLNTGSRVWLEWRVSTGGDSYTDMLVILIKGEQSLERFSTSSHNYLGNSRNGSRGEYIISEDSTYYLGVINLTPRSVVMNISMTVASKVYDTSKATSVCSTSSGVCKLKLPFPNTQYNVLTTSGDEVINMELTFIARLTAYFIITVVIVIIISILLKHLGALRPEQPRQEHQVAETEAETETDPIVPRKVMACAYGATEEEPESSVCCSSEDLYDGKICVICYDVRRNCFFTPCGHCVTCYSCAQRIMEEDKKVCPICRRFIHKAKRLPSS
ncbi:E3 ubiquitin-protein ligase APD2-like [Curcuma longa]|uniref:E3 ubiquitin-protein ligase APD2-like n=1 Tax=Curcuma longa TaxID=136217 RepID=UPI003D9DC0A8